MPSPLPPCIGSSHALGGLEPALALLAGAVASGGWVLLGEGFWEVEPGEAYAAEHPDEEGVEELLAWVADARERVLAPGGRGTLGFALVLWRLTAMTETPFP